MSSCALDDVLCAMRSAQGNLMECNSRLGCAVAGCHGQTVVAVRSKHVLVPLTVIDGARRLAQAHSRDNMLMMLAEANNKLDDLTEKAQDLEEHINYASYQVEEKAAAMTACLEERYGVEIDEITEEIEAQKSTLARVQRDMAHRRAERDDHVDETQRDRVRAQIDTAKAELICIRRRKEIRSESIAQGRAPLCAQIEEAMDHLEGVRAAIAAQEPVEPIVDTAARDAKRAELDVKERSLLEMNQVDRGERDALYRQLCALVRTFASSLSVSNHAVKIIERVFAENEDRMCISIDALMSVFPAGSSSAQLAMEAALTELESLGLLKRFERTIQIGFEDTRIA